MLQLMAILVVELGTALGESWIRGASNLWGRLTWGFGVARRPFRSISGTVRRLLDEGEVRIW